MKRNIQIEETLQTWIQRVSIGEKRDSRDNANFKADTLVEYSSHKLEVGRETATDKVTLVYNWGDDVTQNRKQQVGSFKYWIEGSIWHYESNFSSSYQLIVLAMYPSSHS